MYSKKCDAIIVRIGKYFNCTMILVYILYNLITGLLLLPLTLLFLISKRGRHLISHRLGFLNIDPSVREIFWFHGASAGEVGGLLVICQSYAERLEDGQSVLVTCTNTIALNNLDKRLMGRVLPFDNILLFCFAFRGVSIKSLVISETELWPAMLWFTKLFNIPTHLINARISETTSKSYARLSCFFKPLVGHISTCCVDSDRSAKNFKDLGMDEEKVKVVGNTKYDKAAKVLMSEIPEVQAKFFTEDLPTITLGSIRPDEEETWFPALKHLKAWERMRVVVAPRHKEKFDYFKSKIEAYGFPYASYSETVAQGKPCDQPVLLLDTFGQLEYCYSFSKLAFIGATLVDVGGHNPLEAAQYGVPIVVGPHYFVVSEIISDLLNHDGVIVIDKGTDPGPIISMVIEGNEMLDAMGESAALVANKHRGAVDRTKDILKSVL